MKVTQKMIDDVRGVESGLHSLDFFTMSPKDMSDAVEDLADTLYDLAVHMTQVMEGEVDCDDEDSDGFEVEGDDEESDEDSDGFEVDEESDDFEEESDFEGEEIEGVTQEDFAAFRSEVLDLFADLRDAVRDAKRGR